jgi:hypothetical protein
MEKVIKTNRINTNPYLTNMDSLTLEEFILSQEKFLGAVDNWSKVFGTMVTDAKTLDERFVFIHNLWDEHGNGDLTNSHVNTFKQFISELKKCVPLLDENKNHDTKKLCEISVNKFNTNLNKKMNSGYEDWSHRIAILAMIEHTYIDVSKKINSFVSKYIPSEEIPHYSNHEVMDVSHSTELFKLLEIHFKTVPGYEIETGIEYGYELLNNLYSELYANVKSVTL